MIKLLSIFEITVEPVMLLIAISGGISNTAYVNVILEGACLHDKVHPNQTEASECSQYSTDLNSLKSLLKDSLPAITLLIAGTWRDKHGKNIPLMYLTMGGQIFSTAVLFFASMYLQEVPLILIVLFESIIVGLCGALPLLLMSTTCFIAARTSIEDRTYRMSVLLATYLGGITFGSLISGHILLYCGFQWTFTISMILAVLAVLYLFMFIKEVSMPSKKSIPIWMMFKTFFKARENHVTTVIILMLIIHCLNSTSSMSEGEFYLIYAETGLHYPVTEASLYFAYRLFTLTISTFLVIPVLSKYCKLSDLTLGIISAFMHCISSVWSAFANSTLQIVLSPLANILRGGLYVEKSITTKCVGPNEIGQVLSVQLISAACVHIMFLSLYTFIFNKTSKTFPGAFFLLSALLAIIMLTLFGIAKYLTRNNSNFQHNAKENENSSKPVAA